ncbi:MAG: DNA-3-methyladenine glycosylase I [Clostridiales bacterium]
MENNSIARCGWSSNDPIYTEYHDKEWGLPIHEDKLLFEFLILEGAQAGLSWLTVLKKRDNYRKAFDGFSAEKIAQYGEEKIQELLNNPGIIRNRLKINATIENAKAYLRVVEEFGSFDKYIWQFVSGQPINNSWNALKEIPVKTIEAEKMSKDLLKRGFKFVGPTICYAFMQAVGMVNDHIVCCFRHEEVKKPQSVL